MNLQNIYYSGYFIDEPNKLLSMFPPKHKTVYGHHCTNKYKPKSLNDFEVGKKIMLKITGRTYDTKCDVLLVENLESENEFPHITLSSADGVSPQYSNELLKYSTADKVIEKFDEPKFIEATQGYVIKEEKTILS